MLKKALFIIALSLILPAFADYNPLSDEPIESVEKFYEEQEYEDCVHTRQG